jgi:3-hydroxybutyrate dehydrogenase
MTDLSGRTALITDGAGQIGDAIGDALSAAGARVLRHGPGADLAADLADRGQIAAMMQAAGPIDILVNVACPQHIAPVTDFPPEQWDHILAVGLTAAFHTTRLALPGMLERGWGRIVNMSSVQGLVASTDKSAYVAAKHGLIGFTKAVALETAGKGVTANAFCPGWTGTDGTKAQAAIRAKRTGATPEQALQDMLTEKQPSGQWVSIKALGGLVVFLCSEQAAQITGAALPVDGGWVAQ